MDLALIGLGLMIDTGLLSAIHSMSACGGTEVPRQCCAFVGLNQLQ